MEKEIWSATNIRISLINRIKIVLETKAGEIEGLNNVNQFVDSAVRELLEKLEGYEKEEEIKIIKKDIKTLQEKMKSVQSSKYNSRQRIFIDNEVVPDPYDSKLHKNRKRKS